MSYSISTLLTRNLHDVFGENDHDRRRAASDEIFTEDGVFYDPSGGVYRGRDEIDRVAGAIKATHPDFRYHPIAALGLPRFTPFSTSFAEMTERGLGRSRLHAVGRPDEGGHP